MHRPKQRTGHAAWTFMKAAQSKHTGRRGEQGFTLVELLVVMAILVLLAGIVAPRVIGYLGSSRAKAATVQIESLATSLELYRLDTGRYPSSQEGLIALVRKPERVANWNGPYIRGREVPPDPWGKPYFYRSPGASSAFEIYSLGADGKPNGDGEDKDIKGQ
ncbi:MAG: type II secretion system major pseudopilin GspG [Hyphomicrobiaceae bacterium]